MKNIIKSAFITLAVMVGIGFTSTVLVGSSVQAESAAQQIKGGSDKVGGTENATIKLEDGIKIVVNILLFLIAAIAVIMIIIGGIRYTTSNGDSSQTKSAKDTILYAVVGIVVAILAYAIVNFVVDQFIKGGPSR